ncbi:MAG TPA: DUF885 domain-containing protein, partial [Flavitalea sp.]|nr:DUF885 domain-containing protein [Flavitalea sp.]
MKCSHLLVIVVLLFGCAGNNDESSKSQKADSGFASFIDNYYHQRMAIFPMESTMNGETAYNDKLYASFTDSFVSITHQFYTRTLDTLHSFDREKLDDNEKISYDYLNEYATLLDKNVLFHANWIPTDQIWGLHLLMGQWATGDGAQPFKTVKDYENWLKRMQAFGPWLDSAIGYFRKGIAQNYTLPKPLVRSMIPQFEFMVTKDAASNLYYSPLNKFPAVVSEPDRKRLTNEYKSAIDSVLIPSYRRMATFLKNEYLPAARASTTGISALSDGAEQYKLLVRLQTTTDKTPDEIYNIGIAEVKRIRGLMEKIKDSVGFKGDINAFFKFLNTDPQFTPYKTPEEVLNAFRAIQKRIEPGLPALFSKFPKTPFEIRRTEEFREASASAEYLPSPDNIKPGIFYVPIINATKFNTTSGMQSLFL